MESKKLRVFAAGDIHGDTMLARELADKAEKENADLVVLCGDLTYAETSLKGIVGPFLKTGKQVLIIPGNHETIATADFLSQLYDNVKNLHGNYAKFGNSGFFGCGSANIGLFQLSEDEIYKTLGKGFDYIKELKQKIMVTHVHPSDSLIGSLTAFFPGSTGVRKAIDKFQPDLLLCSHVHEAEGVEEKIGKTRVVSVGRNGKIIEI